MKNKFTPEYLEKRKIWEEECSDLIRKAEYKSAMELAKCGVKLFPNDTIAKYNYYSILADYAGERDTKELKKLHKQAVLGMKGLFKKMSGQGIDSKTRHALKNEYYFQTKQYKKQYNLGIYYFEKYGEKRYLYSSGVGAANYALGFAKANKQKLASKWAMKSIDAWNTYFEFNMTYYNPYVHYAIAWGILGKRSKMMKSLKTSSKLSGQPMTYSEFSFVIRVISEISYLK